MSGFNTPGVLYELDLGRLSLTSGSISLDFTNVLESGRANYVLFQDLVARCTGWSDGSEGGDSDLSVPGGRKAEVKAYYDSEAYPSSAKKYEAVHTAASSTFGPNNKGPLIKKLLSDGRYADALQVCSETGYAKNDFYVYTNTRGYRPGTPFRYLVLPTAKVISNLSTQDPREISRTDLLALAERTEHFSAREIPGKSDN